MLTIGPSPGNSPNRTDTVLNKLAYSAPTCGIPHEKIYYEDTKRFWNKARHLYQSIIRKHSGDLSIEECMSISGNLNFGVGLFGVATVRVIEKKYAEWIPMVTVDYLKPRFIILLGLNTILKDREVNNWISSSGHWNINFNKPDEEIQFEGYEKKRLVYRVWKYRHGKIVMWPQHPSRSPFTNNSIWEYSVREATEKIVKGV
ncbi:MAG: hypothetical protein KAR07_10230 [Spirochaetes bacterium]|nr:hypothetical protein [Spirochaetota bacterium]